MKKILISLLAGAVMTTAFALSAMAAGDTTEGADNAVAKIGDQYYTTVDKAMADAVDIAGETVIIEVLKDINNIPAPTRAGLHFKAANGVKVTYRVNPPRFNKIDGTVTYEGFDFTTYDSGNGLFAAFDGGHELEGLEVVFVDCTFGGQKSVGFSWGVNSNMEKLTIDNCTIAAADASQYFVLGYIDAVEIKNCDFSNHTAGNSIVQLSTTSNNVVITNCKFGTGYINYAANVGTDGKVLKVADCTFEGDKAINVHSNTINAGVILDEITVTDNTLGDTTSVFILPENATAEDFIGDAEVTFAGNETVSGEAIEEIIEGYGAVNLEGRIFANLKSAVEYAEANNISEIELLGDTVEDETVVITEDITINGNGFTVTGKDGINYVSGADGVTPFTITNGANVVLKNIVVVAGGIRSDDPNVANSNAGAGDAIYIENSTLTITDSEIYGGDMECNGGNAGRAINSVNSVIVISESVISNGIPTTGGYGATNLGTFNLDEETELEVSDSTIIANKGNYLDIGVMANCDNLGNIDVSENEVVFYGEINVVGSELNGVKITVPEGETLTLKGSIDDSYIADTITVKYVKKDIDDAGEDTDEQADLYDIVLEGNKSFINRLNSADLTFVLDADSKMSYEIIASNPEIKINPVNNSDNRYEFHFDGKDNVTDTDKAIVIGQVKISGYGTYDFEIDAEAKDEADDKTNVVYATEAADSIVETFIPDGAANGMGELVITNKIDDAYIAVPTRDLTINVDFPNAVVDRVIAYNDMTVTVSGGDLAADVVIKLGNDAVETNIGGNDNKKVATYEAKFDDGAYVVTVKNILTVNNSYNVTVEGAGYRTARYTVTMTDDKTLNFWNNVKDNAVNVEEKKDSSAKNVTFLAGDIVKDAIINIYDLSAVVSYFGEIDLDENNNKTYAKYDLNRDGKIDSKDVAYVLVSWGK
ncbi:MAG: hypothetical protein E7583_07320 [Ruminococcaceae bacterium]|nr:hypothetical protein [Oscillospiraceae bacterium]